MIRITQGAVTLGRAQQVTAPTLDAASGRSAQQAAPSALGREREAKREREATLDTG